MKRFFNWLFRKLGYISVFEYHDMEHQLQEAESVIEHYQADATTLRKHIDELERDLRRLDHVTLLDLQDENNALKLKQDKINANLIQAEQYYKEVQTQLADMMHVSPIMGFPNAMRFPGATVIKDMATVNESGDKCITVIGRSILPDSTTTKIQTAVGMTDKMLIIRNELLKQGILDRITQDLIKSGAISMTLGYNKDCTTCEVYFTVKAEIPESDLIINYE